MWKGIRGCFEGYNVTSVSCIDCVDLSQANPKYEQCPLVSVHGSTNRDGGSANALPSENGPVECELCFAHLLKCFSTIRDPGWTLHNNRKHLAAHTREGGCRAAAAPRAEPGVWGRAGWGSEARGAAWHGPKGRPGAGRDGSPPATSGNQVRVRARERPWVCTQPSPQTLLPRLQ